MTVTLKLVSTKRPPESVARTVRAAGPLWPAGVPNASEVALNALGSKVTVVELIR